MALEPGAETLPFDAYVALGVAPDATSDEIRTAYRRLARALHPDAHPGDQVAAERFRRVARAYGVLGDEERRRRYDLLRLTPRPGPRAARQAPGPTGNLAVRGPQAFSSHHSRQSEHANVRPETDEWSFLGRVVRWATALVIATVLALAAGAAFLGGDATDDQMPAYGGVPGGPGFCLTQDGWISCRLVSSVPPAP
jgi:curved DNA-binding protein CbpA